MKRSQVIALAGISAALAYIFIVVSFYVDVMSISFGVLAAICLMLPLTAGSVLGAGFAYASASILSGLTVGFGAMPFILLYGPFVMVVYLVNIRLFPRLHMPMWAKRLIGYAIKGVVYAGTITALYFVMKAFGNVDTLFEGWMKWVSIALLVVVFFMLDLLIGLVYVNLRHVIRTRVFKIKDDGREDSVPKTNKNSTSIPKVDDDVFSLDDEQSLREEETYDIGDSSSRFAHFLESEEQDEDSDTKRHEDEQ